jgi:hypothetical protein
VSGDELRDALAEVVRADRWRSDCGEATADAILAMPEMQAIRSFFEWFAHRHGSMDDMRQVLGVEARLPESVIDWVLGGPS